MFKFEKLDVWHKAVALYGEIISISDSIAARDQFSLGEQLRRASLSISTNIAEGSGRDGVRESKYFYNIAKGSVYEVVSLLQIARIRGYVSEEKRGAIYVDCDEIAKMLSGLIKK